MWSPQLHLIHHLVCVSWRLLLIWLSLLLQLLFDIVAGDWNALIKQLPSNRFYKIVAFAISKSIRLNGNLQVVFCVPMVEQALIISEQLMAFPWRAKINLISNEHLSRTQMLSDTEVLITTLPILTNLINNNFQMFSNVAKIIFEDCSNLVKTEFSQSQVSNVIERLNSQKIFILRFENPRIENFRSLEPAIFSSISLFKPHQPLQLPSINHQLWKMEEIWKERWKQIGPHT